MSQLGGNNPYYPGSGGGYLPGGSQFSSPGGHGEEKKTEAAHSLRPLTIGQINRATQSHAEAEWCLEGDEMGQITTVAQVVQIQKQATNFVYFLDDGSGRTEGRLWTDTSDEVMAEKWSDIVENVYVRVTGSLKMFGNKRYIHVNNIRPVKDPHEIFFHILEAMTVTSIMERGPPPGPGQVAQQQNVLGATGGTSAYASQSAVQNDELAKLNPMQRAIIEFIASQPQNDGGVHIAAIARAVGQEARSISDALESLVEDGLVYSTFDDAHFQVYSR